MKKKWYLMLGVCVSVLMVPSMAELKGHKSLNSLEYLRSLIETKRCNLMGKRSIGEIKRMLSQATLGISPALKNKILTTLHCAQALKTNHNNILTVIDYSLPSSQKRLWVFDTRDNKLLYHTYVAHGIASGTLYTDKFSNRYNSKASSLGVYKTDQSYYGRHGLSVRLAGLEHGFNDNAMGRTIVMHGSWYVNEDFIKKYGRPGRSWGCPAVPQALKKPIIEAIKGNGLLVIYYPEEHWVKRSRYLHCGTFSHKPNAVLTDAILQKPADNRKGILFVERNKDNKRAENEPIVVISADDYKVAFYPKKVPLKRMLRRQIDGKEYIAISNDEFDEMIARSQQIGDYNATSDTFDALHFVIPEVKNRRGYWATEMKMVKLGRIKAAQSAGSSTEDYTVSFDKSPSVHLKTTHRFIRWLGL